MALQDVIRWLLPREDQFFRILEQQAVVMHRGAQALTELRSGKSIHDVQSAVQVIEHEGDALVHELEEALEQTFVTPIDREDLRHLSSQLDDVLDSTNLMARQCVLFGVEKPTEAMLQLVDVLVKCTALLQEAVPRLRAHDYAGLMTASRTIRQLEKDADQVYRGAVSRLFHDDAIDAKSLLREKAVLEDLETATDRCERVAHTLAHLAIKHG